jgi:N-methylhydantoinase A/oxoprolinase/acetone carboxylase beta subunit
VYERDAVAPGASLSGPAIVEEPYAVIVLPAGWSLNCTATGELVADVAEVA